MTIETKLLCTNEAIKSTNNAVRLLHENLISQQLQIEALVKMLPEDKQIEWLNIVNDLCKKRDIDPATGEKLNTTGELN